MTDGLGQFDVFPGEDRVIQVKGLNGKKVTAAYLGKERATVVCDETNDKHGMS